MCIALGRKAHRMHPLGPLACAKLRFGRKPVWRKDLLTLHKRVYDECVCVWKASQELLHNRSARPQAIASVANSRACSLALQRARGQLSFVLRGGVVDSAC